MTAVDRSAVYRGSGGDGLAGNFRARVVLAALARIAHDAGIAQVGVPRLAERLGMSERAVKYALARLVADGVVVRAVRGTGNRHGSQPRESVWVMRRLPDGAGQHWPDYDWLADQWAVYVTSPRWDGLDKPNRSAVRDAWTGIDGALLGASLAGSRALLGASQVPTTGKPLPDQSQVVHEKRAESVGRHPHAAARARAGFVVIDGQGQADDAEPVDETASNTLAIGSAGESVAEHEPVPSVDGRQKSAGDEEQDTTTRPDVQQHGAGLVRHALVAARRQRAGSPA